MSGKWWGQKSETMNSGKSSSVDFHSTEPGLWKQRRGLQEVIRGRKLRGVFYFVLEERKMLVCGGKVVQRDKLKIQKKIINGLGTR